MIFFIMGRFSGGAATSSIAGGGLTWAMDHTVTSGNIVIKAFRAFAPSGLASSTAITVTHSTTAGGLDCLVGAISVLGADTVGQPSAVNGSAAATAAWSSATVTASSGDALLGGAFCDGVTGSSTPTAPGVEWFDFNDAGQNETETGVYKLSVSGSDTIQGTWSGAVGHVALGVAYKAAGAAGTVVKQLSALGVG